MTENEFTIAFWECAGEGRKLRRRADGERLVYVIADAVDRQACGLKGRPDRASRLRWISGRLRSGARISKAPVRKVLREIELVRRELVDGRPEAGL